jgi:hypothetical protein
VSDAECAPTNALLPDEISRLLWVVIGRLPLVIIITPSN